jgi:proteasome lid subunit RPN8/RPN11
MSRGCNAPELVLSRETYEDVITHAREGMPEEVCGVLGGRRDGNRTEVTAARRVTNVAERPLDRYELDPVEQIRAMEAVEDGGGEVVGFYHSHPRGPDRPSGVDERLATWPDHSYLVLSLADSDDPDVGSWRWTGERFEPETVVLD